MHLVRSAFQTRFLTLALTIASVVACGPGGQPGASGTLAIVVTGLPAGTSANVSVGTTQVTGTAQLTLPAGTYQVVAAPVLASASVMGDRLAPADSEVAATVAAGQTTTVTIAYAVQQQALLLVPTFNGLIEVLTIDDLVADGQASGSWWTGVGNAYTGIAYGPDGRLYLADYVNDAIVVVDGNDLASEGALTPAAVITHASLNGPMGGAFDSLGNLWVGSYDDQVVLRFDGVVNAVGAVDLAPSLILTVDVAGGADGFGETYDVFVDHLDNVWVADHARQAVYRFENATLLSGAHALEPDLFLTDVGSAIGGGTSPIKRPVSLVVDVDGTLYVGNRNFEVSRFDDALALAGTPAMEASAYLDTGIDHPYMVALDRSGALWVGHYYGELVRIEDPGSYTGYVDLSGQLDPVLSWLPDGGSGYLDGGTMKFVPTQGPLAGY